MATGITKKERLGPEALTATFSGRDAYSLPLPEETVVLDYPGRLTRASIIESVAVNLHKVEADGSHARASIAPNAFVLSDNLLALHALAQSRRKADLLYLDLPYNTGMDFQSRQLEHSYKDSRGMAAYVEFMRRRLILMREAMSEDGSIYVHIGHQMVAHLKLVLDELFGPGNFRNLITRRKCSSKNFTTNQYANLNDFILFYTKSKRYKWNQPGQAASPDWISKEYPKRDAKGQYKLVPIHAPGTRNGETGGSWRGMMPPPGKHWQYLPAKLDALDAAGEMHWSRTGNPRRKVYLQADKAIPYTDYWKDFRDAHHQSIAVTGYPTEKNLDMLRMIVGASSDPGDLVVDPFCGSGTTLQAAEELGRRWIGVDESLSAAKAALTRIHHGVEAMGDYVNRSKGGTEIVDLFGPTSAKVGQSSLTKHFDSVESAFLVEWSVLHTHGDAVRTLASLRGGV